MQADQTDQGFLSFVEQRISLLRGELSGLEKARDDYLANSFGVDQIKRLAGPAITLAPDVSLAPAKRAFGNKRRGKLPGGLSLREVLVDVIRDHGPIGHAEICERVLGAYPQIKKNSVSPRLFQLMKQNVLRRDDQNRYSLKR